MRNKISYTMHEDIAVMVISIKYYDFYTYLGKVL